MGFNSLSDNFEVSAVVTGAEASAPRTKKQAAGLTDTMVKFIIRKWGPSASWWRRQCATAFALGFVSIMRMGEVCSIRREGVRFTLRDGSEVQASGLSKLPKLAQVAGILVHLPWRKNHVAKDCWVPVACRASIALILRQLRTLRKYKVVNEHLFPSREFVTGGQDMHGFNHVSQPSLTRALKRALMSCVPGMTKDWVKLYSGHSLRVGGSNQMRKEGVADDVHRRLGGWMSLVSAQGYMSLSAREQYRYTLKLAKSKKRHAGLSKQSARAFLGVRQANTLLG